MVNKLDLQALLFLPSIRCFEKDLTKTKKKISFFIVFISETKISNLWIVQYQAKPWLIRLFLFIAILRKFSPSRETTRGKR